LGGIGRAGSLQAFAASLGAFRARKGVLITTSHFTATAHEYVGQIASKIVLIDGRRLVDPMIEHNVGVEIAKRYELKKIDHDYFDEGGGWSSEYSSLSPLTKNSWRILERKTGLYVPMLKRSGWYVTIAGGSD
jgi:hypothetical protein